MVRPQYVNLERFHQKKKIKVMSAKKTSCISPLFRFSSLIYILKSFPIYLLETVFFTFKQIGKEKQKIKNLAVKKRFPQFLLCIYVCVYICVCVCVFVCLLVVYRRHCLTQEAEILTQIPICKYLKMVSFTFLNFCLFLELFPFSHFLLFSLFQSFQSTYHEDQYTKLKLGTCGIYYV